MGQPKNQDTDLLEPDKVYDVGTEPELEKNKDVNQSQVQTEKYDKSKFIIQHNQAHQKTPAEIKAALEESKRHYDNSIKKGVTPGTMPLRDCGGLVVELTDRDNDNQKSALLYKVGDGIAVIALNGAIIDDPEVARKYGVEKHDLVTDPVKIIEQFGTYASNNPEMNKKISNLSKDVLAVEVSRVRLENQDPAREIELKRTGYIARRRLKGQCEEGSRYEGNRFIAVLPNGLKIKNMKETFITDNLQKTDLVIAGHSMAGFDKAPPNEQEEKAQKMMEDFMDACETGYRLQLGENFVVTKVGQQILINDKAVTKENAKEMFIEAAKQLDKMTAQKQERLNEKAGPAAEEPSINVSTSQNFNKQYDEKKIEEKKIEKVRTNKNISGDDFVRSDSKHKTEGKNFIHSGGNSLFSLEDFAKSANESKNNNKSNEIDSNQGPEQERKQEPNVAGVPANPEVKPEVKPQANLSSANTEAKPEVKPKVNVAKPEVKPKVNVAKPEVKPEVNLSSANTEVKPQANLSSANTEVKPKVNVANTEVKPKVNVANPEVKPQVNVSSANPDAQEKQYGDVITISQNLAKDTTEDLKELQEKGFIDKLSVAYVHEIESLAKIIKSNENKGESKEMGDYKGPSSERGGGRSM